MNRLPLILIPAAFAFFALAFSACARGGSEAVADASAPTAAGGGAQSERILLEGDTDAVCPLNSVLKISLEGNATTGYLWDFEIVSGADKAVFLSKKSEKVGGKDLCGNPEITDFSFKGKAPGLVKIKFLYKRPWEKVCEKEILYNIEFK